MISDDSGQAWVISQSNSLIGSKDVKEMYLESPGSVSNGVNDMQTHAVMR
jgi:hypothetical protein